MQTSEGLQLDPVPYATTGGFAINIWVKTNISNIVGDAFSYIFSHTALGTTNVLTAPNQVHIYIPQANNTFHGISARAILRDSNSLPLGRKSEVWIDTNGMIGNDMPAAVVDDGMHIDDGEWHMLTVSTLPGPADFEYMAHSQQNPGSTSSPSSSAGQTSPVGNPLTSGGITSRNANSSTQLQRPLGFAIYMDGILRGSIVGGSTRDTLFENDTSVQITGGYPADLNGPITLCARVDGDLDRGFTGSVSNLMLFDVPLTPTQVVFQWFLSGF